MSNDNKIESQGRRIVLRNMAIIGTGLALSPILTAMHYKEEERTEPLYAGGEDLNKGYVNKFVKLYDFARKNGTPRGESTVLEIPLKDVDGDGNPDKAELRIYLGYKSVQFEVFSTSRTDTSIPGLNGNLENDGSLNTKISVRNTTNDWIGKYIDAACEALKIK